MATPALITQTISNLNTAKLEKELGQRTALEDHLVALRSSWKKVPTARAEIEKKAAEVQAWLDRIPYRPTISQVYLEEPVCLIDDMTLLFCWLNEQVNISVAMSEQQMTNSAMMLVKSFPYLRLEDVAIILCDGLTGKYGAVYNRLDVTVISDWARQYWDAILDARIERAWSKHASSKEDPTAPRGATETDEAFLLFKIKYMKTNQP